jgi:hypothetical protein
MLDTAADEPFPWDVEPPALTVTELKVRVRGDAPLVTYVVRADERWPGQLAADLFFDREHGPVSLSFAYGYDEPAVVLAAIDNLSTGLAALRERVVRASGGS